MTDEITNPMQTIAEIAARVAEGMESAAIEYGAGAVDLALLAYQVMAIQELLLWAILALPLMFMWKASKALRSWADDGSSEGREIASVFVHIAGFIYSFIGVVALLQLLTSIPMWIAAFGKPELWIATKTLKAAGLL